MHAKNRHEGVNKWFELNVILMMWYRLSLDFRPIENSWEICLCFFKHHPPLSCEGKEVIIERITLIPSTRVVRLYCFFMCFK